MKLIKKEDKTLDIEKERKEKQKQEYGNLPVKVYKDPDTRELVEEITLKDSLIKLKDAPTINGQSLTASGTTYRIALSKGAYVYQKRHSKGSYRELTFFKIYEDIKLRNDEGKRLVYVTSKSIGEEQLYRQTYFSLNTIKVKDYSNVSLTSTASSLGAVSNALGVLTAPTDVYANVEKFELKPAALTCGDLLLVGYRVNEIKFGKAPTAEELLPTFYTYRFNGITTEVVDQTKFQEPVSRFVTFSKSLTYNGGLLLVSTPFDNIGDRAPKDKNPRNYVIRHITDNAKIGYELTLEVPSGYTRFEQCFEQIDGSIILFASMDSDKKEKYFNRKTTGGKGFGTDQFYVAVIKDGKLISTQTLNKVGAPEFVLVGEGDKKKEFSSDMNSMIVSDVRYTNDGLLVFTSIPYKDNTGIPMNKGFGCMQFNKEGKLVKIYWQPTVSEFESKITPQVSRVSENEFLWVVSERLNNEKPFHNTKLVKINISAQTATSPVVVGDEKHVTLEQYPAFINPDAKSITFFGFDLGGKELWKQDVKF